MRIIAILVLLSGMGLAGGGAWYASKYMAAYEAELAARQRAAPEMTRVIAAKQQLRYGQVVEPALVKWVAWPSSAVPEGAFTDTAQLFGDDGKKRRRVLRQVEGNEPLLPVKLTGFGNKSNVAMALEAGKRAFTLPIDAVSGVGGFISPGARVDVLFIREEEQEIKSSVLMKDLEVIATDQNTRSEAGPRIAKTATVEVSEKQAQTLILAQQVGTLTLTLRGIEEFDDEPGEEEDGPIESVSLDELMGVAEEVVEEEKKPEVIVRHGSSVVGRVQIGNPTANAPVADPADEKAE